MKRSKKVGQALELPTCMNINPRSVYNKPEELKAMINEEEIDVTFISESWERQNFTLQQLLHDLEEDYEIISNPFSRTDGRQGGRPAIIIRRDKYRIKNLTNTIVNIPWKIEATWASITPKNVTQDSLIKKIILCSFYYPGPHSKIKTLLLDHINQTFHLLTAKYGEGLHFILGADSNQLDLSSILNLTPNMKHHVRTPTRLNPPRILDTILSTLGLWYQVPVCLPPLQADPGSGGATADHLIPIWKPINTMNNKPSRVNRRVKVRPLPESALLLILTKLNLHDWRNIYNAETAHEKAKLFHKEVMEIVDETAPEKHRNISSDDQPWFDEILKKLDRRRRREFNKNRRSKKYQSLQKEYNSKCSSAKKKFFVSMIRKVREANPGQWYSLLKRISKYDQEKTEQLQIEEINHMTDEEQVEAIAEHFNTTSRMYEEVKTEDINTPEINPESIPQFSVNQIKSYIDKIKTNKSTIPGDIPAKVVKIASGVLSIPMTHMINHSIKTGIWPDSYKEELITPVGKVIPVELLEQLRPISNLPICDKIQEAVISDMVVFDMKSNLDPTQFGNQKHLSIQHYLIRLMDRIVTNVDKNSKGEVNAVLALFVDWKSAYSRQCHKLGIQSFIRNGVRPSLIPLLTNYFQNRQMRVKHHNKISSKRHQPGSGAQGASLGNHEFTSQTNNNADIVPKEDRFKYVDDLTTLEIIDLLSTGMSSYNYKNHVPSDVPTDGHFIESTHLKSQEYLEKINLWTENQKMLISSKKTKAMIINFTENHQFTTRMQLHGKNVEIVDEMKILGTIITNKLSWDKNCKEIIRKVHKRMLLIKKIQSFGASLEELVHLWIVYCRSVLEQSAVLWASSISEENKTDLERTQKSFAKIALKNRYRDYESSLIKLNLESLELRRNILCLNWAKQGIRNDNMKDYFPLNKAKQIETRNHEKYKVNFSNTERMRKGAITNMQHLLNEEYQEKKEKQKYVV